MFEGSTEVKELGLMLLQPSKERAIAFTGFKVVVMSEGDEFAPWFKKIKGVSCMLSNAIAAKRRVGDNTVINRLW